MSRLRRGSKAPLAVAGILAVPLFFVGLMAFSLKLDKPSHHLTKTGKLALGDPTKGTIGTIYLVAFGVAASVVLVAVLATAIGTRLAAVAPAVAGIVASILLMLPLGSWAAQHTKRYPLGVDNIAPNNPGDLQLRGEWEQNARAAARQVAFTTIGIAIASIAVVVALDLRRRRAVVGLPPVAITGEAEASPVVELEQADSDLVRGNRPGRWRW